ncbi:MAG: hypothetical protein ONB44_06615 [candidate division KSB1 bacterium]|nr:hypothetical protein [candidate division KSB1 bacterium]MDZ7301796.1 hypothetical protein [candidate division KSB1 bacterium]MDZ7311425.1 hypothetical protein [candidate division KSB1 bacterium]
MQCERCGEVYPSQYYFKDEGKTRRLICTKCANSLTPEEIEHFLHEPKPEQSKTETGVASLSTKSGHKSGSMAIEDEITYIINRLNEIENRLPNSNIIQRRR